MIIAMKKTTPKKKQDAFAPVQNDPTDVERDGRSHQADAQNQEERDLLAAAWDSHGGLGRLYRGEPAYFRDMELLRRAHARVRARNGLRA